VLHAYDKQSYADSSLPLDTIDVWADVTHIVKPRDPRLKDVAWPKVEKEIQ
jgi:hypothetical protein